MASRKYILNENILDIIDTEEKAYFLGLFYADGYNNEKQGKIFLTLQDKDKDILLKLSKFLFHNRPIYQHKYIQKNKIYYGNTLGIANRHLSEQLCQLGSPQKKTFKIKFPFWMIEQFWKHFIRGYFDGDGSCSKSKNKNSDKFEFGIYIASNPEFCNGLISAIYKLTNLNFKLTPHGKIYIAWLQGHRRIEKFLDWLYQDATIYLERKYNIYLTLKHQNKIIDDNKSYTYFSKNRSKWVARAPLKFKRKFLGYFESKESATLHAKKIIESLISQENFETQL